MLSWTWALALWAFVALLYMLAVSGGTFRHWPRNH